MHISVFPWTSGGNESHEATISYERIFLCHEQLRLEPCIHHTLDEAHLSEGRLSSGYFGHHPFLYSFSAALNK